MSFTLSLTHTQVSGSLKYALFYTSLPLTILASISLLYPMDNKLYKILTRSHILFLFLRRFCSFARPFSVTHPLSLRFAHQHISSDAIKHRIVLDFTNFFVVHRRSFVHTIYTRVCATNGNERKTKRNRKSISFILHYGWLNHWTIE